MISAAAIPKDTITPIIFPIFFLARFQTSERSIVISSSFSCTIPDFGSANLLLSVIFPPDHDNYHNHFSCFEYGFYSAPLCRKIAPTVSSRILISRPMLQLSIYSRSSFTTSSKSLISLLPLTCHKPVIPGVIESLLR